MDSEEIKVSGKSPKHKDFYPMLGAFIGHLDIKFLFYFMIVYLFLHNNVFNEKILSNFDSATNIHGYPTTRGTLILVVMMAIILAMVQILEGASII